MRNLIIYLGALSALSSTSSAVRHGAAQLRDLLAYPKYEVQFLNDLPVSASDADKAKSLGVEREDEWLHLRLGLHDRKRLSDGQDAGPSEVGNLHLSARTRANGRTDCGSCRWR